MEIALAHGALAARVRLDPFGLDVARAGRTLVADAALWSADGTVHDRFVQLTEGVIAREELEPPVRFAQARVERRSEREVVLAGRLGERSARVTVALPEPARLVVGLEVGGAPLRLGIEWARRSRERLV